jgi:hypothetical protein
MDVEPGPAGFTLGIMQQGVLSVSACTVIPALPLSRKLP